MPAPRRLWDSSIVIGYLAGYPDLKPDCPLIIEQAKWGEIEIAVSAMATVEAAYLEGHSDRDSEDKIREFFSRDYIIPLGINAPTAEIARGLIRKYRNDPKIKPLDAMHLAAVIQWHIPIIETTDLGFLRFDRWEGNPVIQIRRPLYKGRQRLSTF